MVNYKIISPQDSEKLTHDDISSARVICEEMREFVNNRDSYISQHSVDENFAIPDGNWSYDSPNEFLRLFLRISKCKKLDMDNLRAFTGVFSGYNLYKQAMASGSHASIELGEKTEQEVKENIKNAGHAVIEEHLSLIRGLPDDFVFKPPIMFGECGYLYYSYMIFSLKKPV